MRRPLLDVSENLSWYLQLADCPTHKTVELGPHLALDLDRKGRVVGIEGRGTPKLPLSLHSALQMAGLAPTLLETT